MSGREQTAAGGGGVITGDDMECCATGSGEQLELMPNSTSASVTTR